MELPQLGTHCAEVTCNKLDFLPFNCNLCHKTFCNEHQSYKDHQCPHAYMKDKRVPTCPLCSQVLPIAKGEDPNQRVNKHIESDCRSDLALNKTEKFTKCNFPSCRKNDMVPLVCDKCKIQYCLIHRFTDQHNCPGIPFNPREQMDIYKSTAKSRTSNSTQSAPENTCRIFSHTPKINKDIIIKAPSKNPVKRLESATPVRNDNLRNGSDSLRSKKEQEELDLAIALSLSEIENSKSKTNKTVTVKSN